MKKLFTRLGISLMMISTITFSVNAQNKGKDKKENHESKGNGNKHKQDNEEKGNEGKTKKHPPEINKWDRKEEHANNKMEERSNGKKNDQSRKKDKDNSGKNEGKTNNGNNDDRSNGNNGKNNKYDGYTWNNENFKDRQKIKNSEKVTICHKFNNDKEPAVTLKVSSHAVKAHMSHGDKMGECAVTDTRFSKKFLDKKTDYYNALQNTQEQVVYSKSILDYAIERLTNSRAQLATLKSKNMPQAEIERKQATVVELEQNVSLLETLIGVAANVVVGKL